MKTVKIGIIGTGGIAVLLVAFYIMTAYNSSVKGKMSPVAFARLLLCGLSNGVADFSQKLFVKTRPEEALRRSISTPTSLRRWLW